MKKPLFATYLTLALTGCAQAVPQLAAPPTNSASQVNMSLGQSQNGLVSATAKLSIKKALKAKAKQRVLLNTTPGWVKNDIDHVIVTLMLGTTEVAHVKVEKADLSKRVTFGNLHRNTTYRVELRAYSDAAEHSQIDNIDVNLASCSKEFTTTNELTTDIGSLPLRLRDKGIGLNSNQAGIVVTDGAATDAAGSETITVAAFDPSLCAPNCGE